MEKEYVTRIWGASDDLIEIDGGSIEDEANPGIECIIGLPDGTQAIYKYDGSWRCEVRKKGHLFVRLVPAVGDDQEHIDPACKNCSGYSDVLIIREPVDWVRVDKKYYRPLR